MWLMLMCCAADDVGQCVRKKQKKQQSVVLQATHALAGIQVIVLFFGTGWINSPFDHSPT